MSTLQITEPGIYDGISNDDYHADPVPGGSLSVSGAKKLLSPSTPAHFKHSLTNKEHKDVFDYGTAAHSIILEGDESGLVVVEASDWRTKAAQEAKCAAYAKGKTPLLTKDIEQVRDMAKVVQEHPIASKLFANGKAEQSAFWPDPNTGVWRRARFDWLPEIVQGRRLIIPDYKTAVSADPEKFSKHAADFRYHMQDPWYRDAILHLGLHNNVAFVFVVQEKTAPYAVNVIELSPKYVALGRDLNQRAIETYAHCVATDSWPAYQGVTQVDAPTYVEYETERILDNAA